MKTDLTTLQPCMVLAVLEAGGPGGWWSWRSHPSLGTGIYKRYQRYIGISLKV